MRRVLAILVCFFLTLPAFADDYIFNDGTGRNIPSGLTIMGNGSQTSRSFGGILLPRTVKLVTRTPEGKVITRFKMPSVFQDPNPPSVLNSAPALLQVEIPDKYGQIYIEGELVRTLGTSRQLESPVLGPSKAYPLRLRGVYKVGNEILIEDKEVLIRAGETTLVTFDGARALRVSLQGEKTQVGFLPAPK